MVSFLHNNDSESCFCEVLRTNTAATATAYEHHIRLEDFWLIACGELYENVIKSLARLAMYRYFQKAEHRA